MGNIQEEIKKVRVHYQVINQQGATENCYECKISTFYPECHPMDNLQQVHPVSNNIISND